MREAARRFPTGPWMYTGALENHPRLVDAIAAERPLWGNPGRVLRQVRDPWRVTKALTAAGLACPALARSGKELGVDGSWLRKARRSGGGLGVDAWIDKVRARHGGSDTGWFFQQRIEGKACAALYVAFQGRARLLGVTEQLIGSPWLGASAFQYAGSIGPLPLESAVRRQFERIGEVLSRDFALAGLFGVDAVLNQGTVWPVEVNPRYPASAEIIERSTGICAVELHATAFGDGRIDETDVGAHTTAPGAAWSGKAVVYARRDCTVTQACSEHLLRLTTVDPPLAADIPAAGSQPRQGEPILTVLADGDSRNEVAESLRGRAGEAERMLYL